MIEVHHVQDGVVEEIKTLMGITRMNSVISRAGCVSGVLTPEIDFTEDGLSDTAVMCFLLCALPVFIFTEIVLKLDLAI
jgi:hypothetical protein